MNERSIEMLEALLAATEAAWAACERDASSIDQVAELVRNRGRCLAQLDVPIEVSPRERELAARLQQLDLRLLDWCEQRRRELGQQLSQLRDTNRLPEPARVDEATVADVRILSDFA